MVVAAVITFAARATAVRTRINKNAGRGGMAAALAGCAVVTGTIATNPLQWAMMTLLPATALIGAAETVLAQRRHLEAVLDSFERMSMTDALTGLLNRRGMTAGLFAPSGRVPRHLSVLMLDIDNFKTINDRHGHVAGDEVLRAVGSGLLRETRNDDLVARLGGEEFVVVSRIPPGEAAAMAERVRERAGDWMAPWSGTLSVGGVTVELTGPGDLTADLLTTMLDGADRCLYRAKRSGRNRVVLEPPASAE